MITLKLEHNQLTEIEDEDLNNISRLQRINIDKNKIKRIRNSVFSSLNGITIISLRSNGIKLIESDAFIKREYIDFSNNQIEIIPSDMLVFLTSLKYLSFRNSRIFELPYGVLSPGLQLKISLIELNLSNNFISSLTKSSLQGKKHKL